MNDIDRKILEELKKNARVSFVEIGRKLGITEGTVRYRVSSLMKKGVIKKFTVETYEEGIRSIVMVRLVPQADIHQIYSKIMEIRGVERVYEVAGDFDMVILVRASDSKNLNKILDAVRAVNGIVLTRSYVVLQEHG